MAYPVAQGATSYSGNYIPEIWSTKIQEKFYAGTCLSRVANSQYEGEVKNMGDKVKIRTRPDIIITDYQKDEPIVAQEPLPAVIELAIDRGKKYAWKVHPLDEKQADINFVDEWSRDTSEKMKIAIETDVYANIAGDADEANQGLTAGAVSGAYNLGATGTPLTVTTDTVVKLLVNVASVLSEQNVPSSDRWIIMPVWMGDLVMRSELKVASLTGDDKSILRTGAIGRVHNLVLYESNLLSWVMDGGHQCWNVLAGHKSALTFATQLIYDELVTLEKTFGQVHRGLQVFGFKTVTPKALVNVYVKPDFS